MKPSRKFLFALSHTTIFSAMIYVCAAGTVSTTPFSDAFVATGPGGSLSVSNFGGAGALSVAASGLPQGEFQSVLQFHLTGARSSFDTLFGAGQWTVESVMLQLTAASHNNPIFNDNAAGQFNISWMQNNSWVEGTGTAGRPTTDGVTYSSLQTVFVNPAADQALGTFSFGGGSTGENSYMLNLAPGLTSGLLAGNNASLRLSAADDRVSYLFSSRTIPTVANRPTLIISAVPEPGNAALGIMGMTTLAFCRFAGRPRR